MSESGATGLSPFEKETIINFNLGEKLASVYTAQKGMWLKLERRGWKANRIYRNSRKVIIAKEFLVPKGRISVLGPRGGVGKG